jgi:hypothetical protein
MNRCPYCGNDFSRQLFIGFGSFGGWGYPGIGWNHWGYPGGWGWGHHGWGGWGHGHFRR